MRLGLLLLLALAGCAKEAEESRRAGKAGEFMVERLFTNEGCTVYRFLDAGYHRYYVVCDTGAARAFSSEVRSAGKSAYTDQQEIDTIKRDPDVRDRR